ncbi:MAG: hypothetical protein ACK5UQ_07185 [Planctomycetota bacterium]
MSSLPGDGGRSGDGFQVDALELVLQQGSEAQRAATRQRLADDPLLAIELAEARMLVEEFRTLRTEPGRRYDRLLNQLCARAERSRPAKPGLFGRRWAGPLLAAAAAVLAFVGLRAIDPLGCFWTDESLRDPIAVAVPKPSQERTMPELVVPVHIETRDEVLFADAVEVMRRQLDGQASPLLREALEAGLAADVRLDRWVLPRNALELMRRDQQNWERSLPELVGHHVAPGVLGEAGRLLARLPGVDVEARRAGLVRQLVLGQLRSRRVPGNERPEVVAALVYGFADLLAERERDELEHELLRWRPLHLVPDFATAQQQAWGLLPGRLGFTRLQTARRRLAMLPSPAEPTELAGLCLCLCTDYAAFPTAAAEAALGD